MAETYNSSSRIVGTLNQQKDIIFRGRVRLTANTGGPQSVHSPYFYDQETVDIDLLKLADIVPRVEVTEAFPVISGSVPPFTSVRYCPYTDVELGTKNIQSSVNVFYGVAGSEPDLFLSLTVTLFSIESLEPRDYFITVYNQEVARFSAEKYKLLN